MDDHARQTCRDRSAAATATTPPAARAPASAETVRTRWMPKPEQILILESIFNSGMVNPPKDETIRIRKLLEKFGSVGDANVFYWFQNRRSRSRRRQRQLQLAAAASAAVPLLPPQQMNCPSPSPPPPASSPSPSSSSSSGFLMEESGGADDDLFSISRQMATAGFMQSAASVEAPLLPPPPPPPPYFMCSSDDAARLQYQQQGSSMITVFIDGVPSEVPRGPIDLGAIFGQNVMLVHSSGEILPVSEDGMLMQSLEMGESYFLATKPL